MIAKGNLHAHGTNLARYLTADQNGERAELVELRGFVATNIRDAFIDVQIQAEATRATKPFFHAYVRLPEGEGLAREQWRYVADRLERQLGFTGQPRAVALHEKGDGWHLHVAWSRIDLDSMRAIDPGLFKNKLKQISRKLEEELGLTRVRDERAPDSRTQAASQNEFEQSRRIGTDLKEIRNAIRDCWDRADSGKAFTAALDEHGLILARGDRRDFVVVDGAGGDHVLGKKVTGATAAVTRARLADLDPQALPNVAVAKELQQMRQQEERVMTDAGDGRADRSIDPEQPPRQDAAAAEQKRDTKGHEAEDRRRAEQRAEADRAAKQNADRLAEQSEEMQQVRERLDAFEKAQTDQARLAREAKARSDVEQQHRADREHAGTRDARERYGQALADNYDIRDPYGSLAKAAMAEFGAFRKDRAELDRLIATEKDPAKREQLEFRQKIELADYMAITSLRIAQQSDVISSSLRSAEGDIQRGRAAAFQAEAKRLRVEMRSRANGADPLADPAKAAEPEKAAAAKTLEAEKIQTAKVPDPATPTPPEHQTTAPVQQPPKTPTQTVTPEPEPQPVRPQAEAAAGKESQPAAPTQPMHAAAPAWHQAGFQPLTPQPPGMAPQPVMVQQVPEKRVDPYVTLATDELAKRGSEPPPKQFSPMEFATKPDARREYFEQQAAEQERVKERNAALDRIQKNIESNQAVQGRDMRKLSREDLKGIREKGGGHLKDIAGQRAKEREKESGRSQAGGRTHDR